MTDADRETGFVRVDIADIDFSEQWGADVAPLRSAAAMPVILIEEDDCYRLLDGWGRVSGLVNAGRDEVHAILVSAADLARRQGADDDEWGAAMYAQYAPSCEYRRTTN